MDVKTNTIGWQNQLDQMCIGGSLATAGGLVFYGEANGNFNAFDAETGEVLWQFQTGAGVNAPPITYEIDGTQYIAVASGGNFQLNFPRGDSFWVFSLEGTLGPVAAPPEPSSEVAADAYSADHVDIVDFAFDPGTIIVPPGTTVTWTNTGAAAALGDVDRLGDEPGHVRFRHPRSRPVVQLHASRRREPMTTSVSCIRSCAARSSSIRTRRLRRLRLRTARRTRSRSR